MTRSPKTAADAGRPSQETPAVSVYPAWIPCPYCDEFWCTIHRRHAFECECPAIEEWNCDPYTNGRSNPK